MGITALSGPFVQFGITVGGSTNGLTGNPADYNDQRAPMVADLGHAMMDPRAAYSYAPGGAVTNPVYAFYNNRAYIDYVPTPASTIAIVANTASSDEAGTAMTLATASSANGTYSVAIVAPETGQTTGSLLTFDSSSATVRSNAFGTSDTINTWSPSWLAGRCVQVVTSSYTDSPITVHGRDVYGYKISETISISSAASLTSSYGGVGVKAFKQIVAVYNSTTPTSTAIYVGTTNRFGFPLYTPYYGQDITVTVSSIAALMPAAVILSTANAIVAMASTATATSTTADVRGIYISSATFNNDYRLQIRITPAASAVEAITSTNVAPLFGANQYSS